MPRWSGRPGLPVSTPGDELWSRIRGATGDRDSAERRVMDAASPTSYADLKSAAGRAVRAGGEAFAGAMFKPDDDYRDASGRRVSYEDYLRAHGLLR